MRAHTLPEGIASQRTLAASGFAFVGEVEDPEDGRVFRYERGRSEGCSGLRVSARGMGVRLQFRAEVIVPRKRWAELESDPNSALSRALEGNDPSPALPFQGRGKNKWGGAVRSGLVFTQQKHVGGPPMKLRIALLLAGSALMMPATASSHFNLMEPAPTLNQDARGNPQKKFPCGGTTADAGTASGAVTTITGGQKLHIKIKETVYHPGHYRIALARNPAGLPVDPETVSRETEKGPFSVSAKIDPAPKPPVLADGLFVHNERPTGDLFWETDVRVPNIDCEKCTLQVIQWMGEHSFGADGGYSYHHCVDMKITVDPKVPVDKEWK